ncbi:metallophosphoesterase [Candidatus Woesearchaeota archaeon]|nr:metallophosphoesterase [Candidatus Woesearchaeota archaeon]
MRIGIISDTHDQVDKIKKAVKRFKKEKIVLLYYLGDICSPFVLDLFGELQCSIKVVFGNNDGDRYKLLGHRPGNMEFFDNFYVDEFNGKKICITHGDPEKMVQALFESRNYDVILRGHSHVAKISKNEKTIMINPGCLVESFSDKNKHWTKPSIAIYDIEKDKAKIIKV